MHIQTSSLLCDIYIDSSLIINNKHVFSSRDKIYKRYTEMIYNFPYTIYIYKELKYRK